MRDWIHAAIASYYENGRDKEALSVVFLASDDASFITGHVLVVDGGWTAA